jgi:EAL domain-containing protein (putative c-di-GMP-specific phosphodiesterase class I)
MSSSAPVARESRFLDDMDRQLAGWDDPVARLRRALERNDLVAYAQPVVALRGPEPVAFAEVLVRMREEERALLPPGEFLPVFEHFGMMRDLDAWVVRRAIERLARGARVPRLSINVSDQSLDDAEFASFVAAELQRAGVKADALVFELDEKDVLARPAVAARFAVSLKEIGCRTLIDGFGRRAVSFAPLTALRADYVKVDGVIVRKLGSSDMARSKLNAIVLVGDATGVAVIGESVESPEMLAQLKAAGVGYAQGFGLQPPAPLDDQAS